MVCLKVPCCTSSLVSREMLDHCATSFGDSKSAGKGSALILKSVAFLISWEIFGKYRVHSTDVNY